MLEVTILGSGSGGNAMALRAGDEIILVDAGFSARELARRLERANLDPDRVAAVLVSHEHSDHVRGLRVFCKRHGNIPIYANSLTAEYLHLRGAAPEQVMVFTNGSPFAVGAFHIEPFSISHDACDPVGFIVNAGGRKVGIATDLGHPGKMVPLKLHDSDVLILESNHEPELLLASNRPPTLKHRILGNRGHLSNQVAAELVPRVVGPRTRHLIMAHLSEECNRSELVQASIGTALGHIGRADIQLLVASQETGCDTIQIAAR